MKRFITVSAFSLFLGISSCDMDGAENPANSAESSDKNNTGMEMTGAPANGVAPVADTAVTTTADTGNMR